MMMLRKSLRWGHIIAGLFIGTYLLSPLQTNATATLAAQVLVITLGISGLAIWQWPRVAKALFAKRSGN